MFKFFSKKEKQQNRPVWESGHDFSEQEGREKEAKVVLKVTNLEKIFEEGKPNETRALRGVNMEITKGEIVVIFGPSGSGKSTMLNILAGLDEPTRGSVVIDGQDISKMTEKEKVKYHQNKLGMVFQAYNLVPAFTVMQNITMPARLAGYKKNEYIPAGEALLKQFELEKLAYKLPEQCSGGQQQRIGIMRALINNPSFIIADEPTGNLDSENSRHTMKLFQDLNAKTNTTMLIVTHDPSLFSIADRVVHVLDGKVTKQTILTPKAKIDEARADVPVEVKLRKKTDNFDSKTVEQGEVGLRKQKEKAAQKATRSAFDKLLARREKLSIVGQHVLAVLISVFSEEQKHSLSMEQLERIITFVEERGRNNISQSDLQKVLDLPFKDGGVGLYRQTAERVAAEIEAIFSLGAIKENKNKKKKLRKNKIIENGGQL